MHFSRPTKIILAVLTVIIALNLAWLVLRETPEQAKNWLTSNGLELTGDVLIKEIEAGNRIPVLHYIRAGAHAGSQNGQGESALMAAAKGKDSFILKLMFFRLPKNADLSLIVVNLFDKDGNTALVYAIEEGHTDFVRQLLAHRATPATTNTRLESPLLIAASHGDPEIVSMIIEADKKNAESTINLADNNGNTPLLAAIRQKSPALVKLLLDSHADPLLADLRGTTPLMVAAHMGNTEVLQILITAGAKPDVADNFGNTPLLAAIRNHQNAAVKFLIGQHADPDFRTRDVLPLQATIETEPFDADLFAFMLLHSKQAGTIGAPLLFRAVDSKNISLLQSLLATGLDPNVTNEDGESLLYHAVDTSQADMALYLIDKGADIRKANTSSHTLLERAARHGETTVVEKLLALGVNPEERVSEGFTLSELMVVQGDVPTLFSLLKHGAKLNNENALFLSLHQGKGKVVPLLLDLGTSVDYADANGRSLLSTAAGLGEVEATKALIEHKAAIEGKDSSNMTPLANAAKSGQFETVKLLVEAGAHVEAADDQGMTPLAHAAYTGKPEVVEYLLSRGANPKAVDIQGRSVLDYANLAPFSTTREQITTLLGNPPKTPTN